MGAPSIVLVRDRIHPAELRRMTEAFFVDMEYVFDVERGVAAVGGELRVDGADLLLDDGSLQEHLWGTNYYPGRGPDDCVEYVALINIRPAHGNRSMGVEDPVTRARILELTAALIGTGEAFP